MKGKFLNKKHYSSCRLIHKQYITANYGMTYLAVLTGLGSKLPCASTDPCFSSVAPELVSTKSGDRAPAMAQRQGMAILKSSASYFYTSRRHRQRLQTGVPTFFFLVLKKLITWINGPGARLKERHEKGAEIMYRKLGKSVRSNSLSQTDK